MFGVALLVGVSYFYCRSSLVASSVCLDMIHVTCSGYLMRHGLTKFPYMIRVFFALTLASTGVGQNSSMAADQGKAQVRWLS